MQRHAADAQQAAGRATPQARLVLKPPPIGHFTGDNLQSRPIEHFVEDIDRHFGLLESQGATALPELAKVQFVLTHLKGEALELWRAEEAERSEHLWTLAELKLALQVKFQEHLARWAK